MIQETPEDLAGSQVSTQSIHDRSPACIEQSESVTTSSDDICTTPPPPSLAPRCTAAPPRPCHPLHNVFHLISTDFTSPIVFCHMLKGFVSSRAAEAIVRDPNRLRTNLPLLLDFLIYLLLDSLVPTPRCTALRAHWQSAAVAPHARTVAPTVAPNASR
jgi:hypothetical protein